ncbi:hypothetical protein PFISCL1PPCAC_861, partial [Pristionchus fissidentatus]
IPRSIIVEGASIYSTTSSITHYFNKEYGVVVSVNYRALGHKKLFAVNFQRREDAANAWNKNIHMSTVQGEPFVLCKIVKN